MAALVERAELGPLLARREDLFEAEEGALDGVESLRIERDRDYDWDESEIAPAVLS